MEKKTIGIKAEYHIALVALMILGGLALIAGGLLFFWFVMRGAIGGGITGVIVFCGGYLISLAIMSKILPSDLVQIDTDNVYLNKKTININQIKTVSCKGKALIIVNAEGKKITQGLIKNCEECAKHILESMHARL